MAQQGMKNICTIWLVFFLLFSACLKAQDFQSFIAEGERLEKSLHEKEALQKFKEALKLQPVNLYALAKCSELCSRVGFREKNHKTRDEYYQAAAIYGKTALKFHPQSDEAHVVMAIALGRTALTKSGKEKIGQVKEIRHHAEEAIRLNHNNFKAWHILGKWNYEVCNLNMVEKAAIKVFYGGLPSASYKAAIQAYEKARAIRPDFMLNYLELAKAYKKNDEDEKAMELLRMIQTMPVHTEDDPRIRDEAAALIRKWD